MSNEIETELGLDANAEVEPDVYEYADETAQVENEAEVDRDYEVQPEEEQVQEEEVQQYVPPPTGTAAEVILLITSFGAARKPFFSSKRAKNFMDCKSITYYMVDTNKDVAEGSGRNDTELYQSWREKGYLMVPEGKEEELVIPQILIDGHSIGDDVCLQDLEEDGDLDWLLARAACPKCLNEKSPESASCGSCGLLLCAMIPPELAESTKVNKIYKGKNVFDTSDVNHHPSFKNEIEYQPATYRGEDWNYENLFGEPPNEAEEAA